MDFALLSKVAVVVVAAGFWFYHKSGGSSAAAGPLAAPPPIPRRARRTRPGAVAPARAALAETGESAAATPPRHPDLADLRVTRPVRARVRADFRGVAALRRAVIAREVLGPPLSLRPPRR